MKKTTKQSKNQKGVKETKLQKKKKSPADFWVFGSDAIMGVHIFISFTKELVRFRERRGATSTWCLEGKWEHLWKPRVSTIIGQKPIIIYNNACSYICSYIGVVCAYKVCKLAHTSFQQKYEKILKTRKLNGNDFVREAFAGKKGRRRNTNSFLCVTCKLFACYLGHKKKGVHRPGRPSLGPSS